MIHPSSHNLRRWAGWVSKRNSELLVEKVALKAQIQANSEQAAAREEALKAEIELLKGKLKLEASKAEHQEEERAQQGKRPMDCHADSTPAEEPSMMSTDTSSTDTSTLSDSESEDLE